MFTKYISKNIQEKMKAKERALARKSNSGGLSMKDISTRTAFVRMASNKSVATLNKLIEGGLRSGDLNDKQFGFNNAYDFKASNDANREIKPLPGIKSIECSYKGGFKAIRECTVNWVVPHIDMLNELTPYFFTIGKTVVVDWGWVYGNQNIDKQLVDTFISFRNDESFRDVIINQDIFDNPQDLILKKNGDYDAIGGQITNFEYNLREDGGFDCITKVISMGSSLFKKPIDRGGNQAGFKISGNNAKSTPPDSLINCVLNLKNILLSSSFNIRQNLENERIIRNIALNITKGLYGEDGNPTEIPAFQFDKYNLRHYYKGFDSGYALHVDDKKNPNVLWALFDGKEEFFVTWGWMEDNIINRYVSFEAGDDRRPKLTMRSVDTILDEEGLPISTEDLGDEAFGPDGLQEKYDIDLNISELNNFVKRETLIRNPPGLFPVNPFLFFIPDTEYKDELKPIETGRGKAFQGSVNIFNNENRNNARNKFYSDFRQILIISDSKMKRFSSPTTTGFGRLRNIWVNIKEIQKAFGISNPKSSDTSTSNINPPGTIDVAISNLLTSLNTNFHNIWDFELGVDPYDSTNIKVIDKSDAEIRNPQYTTYQENSHLVQDNGGGIFQFPTFKVGSFVKNQSLQFKIPNAQAITILYGSNKPKGNNDPEYANGQLDKLFRNDIPDFKDAYLGDMKSSHQNSAGEKGAIKSNIGSQNVNPNSRISFSDGFGVPIDTNSTWWRQWTPDIDKSAKKKGTADEIEDTGYYEVTPTDLGVKVMEVKKSGTTEVRDFYGTDDNGHLILNSRIQNRLNSYLNANSPVQQFDMSNLIPAELGLEIDGTGGIIPFDIIHTEYIEDKYKSELISYAYVNQEATFQQRQLGINTSYNGIGPTASGLTAESSIEEQSKILEEIEEKPKAELGPLTYFQLFDVTHVIDESGWKTQLNSKMRINHIPRDDFVTFTEEGIDNPQTSIPSFTDVDIEGDVDVGDEDFNEFEDFDEFDPIPIPAPPNRPNIPLPIEEEDIAGDEDLEDLDFDDIPPWIPPSSPSTLSLRGAKTEIELQPEKVPEQAPPDVPPLDVGPIMSPDDIDKLLAKAVTDGTSVNNDTDLVEYPPEPEPTVPPSQPSAPVVGNPPEAEAPSKKEQLQTQKIIYVHPSPELTNETGQVTKAQRFETPTFEEVELDFSSPTVATVEVNKNIRVQVNRRAKLPPSLIESREVVDLKSTYKGNYEQNEVLYSIREDWRPLYLQSNNNPGGSEKDSNDNLQPLLRERLSFSTRQRFWDKYIEKPNEGGVTKVNTSNFRINTTPISNAGLLRTQRSVYWYGSFNPNYSGS